MNTAGTGAMHCAHCGRPAAALVWLGGQGYHDECTRGPGWTPPTSAPPASLPAQHYTVPMDDERVRQIVRQEIANALSKYDMTRLLSFRMPQSR